MPISHGFETRCGAGQETTFGTVVTVDELIPLVSENAEQTFLRIVSDWKDATAAMRADYQGPKTVTGTIDVEFVYDDKDGSSSDIQGVGLLIKMALGGTTLDSSNTLNQIACTNNLDVFFTLAWEKVVGFWEMVSTKVNSMTITGNAADGRILGSFDLMGWDLRGETTWGGGTVASNTSLSALTYATDPESVQFSQLVFRIADDGNGLADGDKVNINSFTVTVNNNLTAHEFSTEDNSTHTDDMKTLEFERNGFREVLFSFVVPRYTADTFLDYLENDEKLQADLVFDGAGSDEMTIFLPTLKVESVSIPVPDDAGVLSQTINCRCFKQHADNTAMDWKDGGGSPYIEFEIGIEMKNDRTDAI